MQKQPLNYATYPHTVTQLNKIIQKHFPHVAVVKEKKRFYLHSDHPATEMKILALYNRAIYVLGVNYLTFREWVDNIQSLFNEEDVPHRVR